MVKSHHHDGHGCGKTNVDRHVERHNHLAQAPSSDEHRWPWKTSFQFCLCTKVKLMAGQLQFLSKTLCQCMVIID